MSEPDGDRCNDDALKHAYHAAVQKRMQLIEELYQLNCRFADIQREIARYEAQLKKAQHHTAT
jgi:uncharacterized small protein (DUF1192 family)